MSSNQEHKLNGSRKEILFHNATGLQNYFARKNFLCLITEFNIKHS